MTPLARQGMCQVFWRVPVTTSKVQTPAGRWLGCSGFNVMTELVALSRRPSLRRGVQSCVGVIVRRNACKRQRLIDALA